MSWRKPVTFGLSFGLTALAVAWITGFLGLGRRAGWLLLGGLGVACALEVAWVILQAWRDVPAHFAEDAVGEALFIAAGVSGSGWYCSWSARASVVPSSPTARPSTGHRPAIDRPPTDVDLAVFGAAGAFAGRSPLDLSVLGALLGMAGLSILAASFTVALVGLARQSAAAPEGGSAPAG